MNSSGKNWLDLYVDAMLEKDPYKRLAMVRKLRRVPRQNDEEGGGFDEVPMRRTSKGTPRHTRNRQR